MTNLLAQKVGVRIIVVNVMVEWMGASMVETSPTVVRMLFYQLKLDGLQGKRKKKKKLLPKI